MYSDIKKVIERSSGTLVQDIAGLTAVIVMLFGALYIPGLG